MAFQNKDDNQAESKVAQIIYSGDNKKKTLPDLNEVQEGDSSDDDMFRAGLPDDFKNKMSQLDKQGGMDISKEAKRR